MNSSSLKLSESYRQLYKLFEFLENARFTAGPDFGENLSGCFQWFVAPAAVTYLERLDCEFWQAIKKNPKVIFVLEPWQGFKGQAASISFK